MKEPVLQIFQLVVREEHRKDQEMEPLARKAQPTNGSVIIQVFDDFLDKFVQQISDSSICRSLSERPINFHLVPQPFLHCGCDGMFHKDSEVMYESSVMWPNWRPLRSDGHHLRHQQAPRSNTPSDKWTLLAWVTFYSRMGIESVVLDWEVVQKSEARTQLVNGIAKWEGS